MRIQHSPARQSIRLVERGVIMEIQDAIGVLVSTYKPLEEVARGLVVDAQEVQDAYNLAEIGSLEYTVLAFLLKYNPLSQLQQNIEYDTTKP